MYNWKVGDHAIALHSRGLIRHERLTVTHVAGAQVHAKSENDARSAYVFILPHLRSTDGFSKLFRATAELEQRAHMEDMRARLHCICMRLDQLNDDQVRAMLKGHDQYRERGKS